MIEISKEQERKLKKEYEDCLKLKEKDDLTEFRKGMLCVLEKLFLS